MTSLVDTVSLLVVLLTGVLYVRDALKDDPDPVEQAHQAYREGEIDEAELERRLDVALDPRVERIREIVEPVNGVGPSIATEIATEFDTVVEVEQASVDKLQAVSGVGEQRAEAIHERLE